jgi:hypothetical protein
METCRRPVSAQAFLGRIIPDQWREAQGAVPLAPPRPSRCRSYVNKPLARRKKFGEHWIEPSMVLIIICTVSILAVDTRRMERQKCWLPRLAASRSRQLLLCINIHLVVVAEVAKEATGPCKKATELQIMRMDTTRRSCADHLGIQERQTRKVTAPSVLHWYVATRAKRGV